MSATEKDVAGASSGGSELDRGAEALVDRALDVAHAVGVADHDYRHACAAQLLDRRRVRDETAGDDHALRRDLLAQRVAVLRLRLDDDRRRRDLVHAAVRQQP